MFTGGFVKIAKVFAYRNIRKSKDSYTYSIKGPKGNVEQHTSNLVLLNPELKVSSKGKERVRSEKQKNVHAGIKGDIGKIKESDFNWRPITYDPYKYDTFVYRDTKEPVNLFDAIKLTPQGVVAGEKK